MKPKMLGFEAVDYRDAYGHYWAWGVDRWHHARGRCLTRPCVPPNST